MPIFRVWLKGIPMSRLRHVTGLWLRPVKRGLLHWCFSFFDLELLQPLWSRAPTTILWSRAPTSSGALLFTSTHTKRFLLYTPPFFDLELPSQPLFQCKLCPSFKNYVPPWERTINCQSRTHPRHSQSYRLLTSSLSVGVPVPRPTECMWGVFKPSH